MKLKKKTRIFISCLMGCFVMTLLFVAGCEAAAKTSDEEVLLESSSLQRDAGSTSTYYCTRAEYVKLLWLMSGHPAPLSNNSIFSDISSGDEFFDAVQYSQEDSLIGGSNGLFLPAKRITRAQAALILWKYAGKPYQKLSNSKFPDVNNGTLTNNTVRAILWCEKKGLIKGSNGLFRPMGTLTTRQAVLLLYKYAKNYPTAYSRNIWQSDHTAVMIGDSFGKGTGGGVKKGWQAYYSYYSAAEGYLFNAAGSGFYKQGKSNTGTHPHQNFKQLAETAYREVPDPLKVTQVIFGGGLNDWVSLEAGDEEGLRKAVEDAVITANQLFPNAEIYIIPFWGDSKFTGTYIKQASSDAGNAFPEEERQLSLRAMQIIHETAQDLQVYTTMDFIHVAQGGYDSYGIGKLGFGDGKHLNDAGYRMLGLLLSFYLS